MERVIIFLGVHMKVFLVLMIGLSVLGGTERAGAEMLSDTSQDEPECCQKCHITENCRSPEASSKTSSVSSPTKSGGPGTAAEAQ